MKIDKALLKFVTQLEADGRAPSTIDQYQRHIHLFSHWSRDVGHSGDVSDITHEDIAAFLSSSHARTGRHGGHKKATTMNVLRTSLRVFCQFLHEAGYISHNPGRLIRRAVCASPPPRALSEKEIARLMATIARGSSEEDQRDHVLFQLMLCTGIRLGSAVALDVEDVDLRNGTLHLATTKRNQPDQVFLGKEIRKQLRRHLKDHPEGPLFTTSNGRRLSRRQVQRRFSEWTEKAGINRNASLHSLRHTLGSSLYRRTGDIFLVKQALGHRSISSSLIYAQPDEKRLQQVMKT